MAALAESVTTKFFFPRAPFISGIPRMDYGDPSLVMEEVPVHEVYDEALGFSRLYTEKGELLVLISGGCGTTWTANQFNGKDVRRRMLMDARIVRFYYDTYLAPLMGDSRPYGERGRATLRSMDVAPMQQFLEDLGFADIHLGGVYNLAIEIVPPNTRFRVAEYDWRESLVFYREQDWEIS